MTEPIEPGGDIPAPEPTLRPIDFPPLGSRSPPAAPWPRPSPSIAPPAPSRWCGPPAPGPATSCRPTGRSSKSSTCARRRCAWTRCAPAAPRCWTPTAAPARATCWAASPPPASRPAAATPRCSSAAPMTSSRSGSASPTARCSPSASATGCIATSRGPTPPPARPSTAPWIGSPTRSRSCPSRWTRPPSSVARGTRAPPPPPSNPP